jgi:hypothetical protein
VRQQRLADGARLFKLFAFYSQLIAFLPALLNLIAKRAQEPRIFPRLQYEIAHPALHGFDSQFHRAPCRHRDHRQRFVDRLNVRQQIEALLAGGGVARVVQVDEAVVRFALKLVQHGRGRLQASI